MHAHYVHIYICIRSWICLEPNLISMSITNDHYESNLQILSEHDP